MANVQHKANVDLWNNQQVCEKEREYHVERYTCWLNQISHAQKAIMKKMVRNS